MMTQITPDRRKQIIAWINRQDIFRMKCLYEENELSEKEKRHLRLLMPVLREDEYITGLERDQYLVNKQIPLTIKTSGTF